jgi:hypothetical protein
VNNFDFYNPTQVLFGQGQIAALSRLVPAGARVLMLYGGGSIKQNGVFAQVQQALEGHTVLEFSGIEPNPTYETLMRAVALVKAEKIDFLLAVGGGSVIDGTKFVAAGASAGAVGTGRAGAAGRGQGAAGGRYGIGQRTLAGAGHGPGLAAAGLAGAPVPAPHRQPAPRLARDLLGRGSSRNEREECVPYGTPGLGVASLYGYGSTERLLTKLLYLH